MKSLTLFLAGLLVASLPAAADALPDPGTKNVAGEIVFTNLDAFEGYSFVLVETSGPNHPEGVRLEAGVPQSKLSYRWWRPVLVAVKDPIKGVEADGRFPSEAILANLDGLPHNSDFSTGPNTTNSWSSAATVVVTYKVTAVEGTEIKLEQVGEVVALDEAGNPTSLEGAPLGLILGGVVGAMLLLGVIVLRRKGGKSAEPAATAEPATD